MQSEQGSDHEVSLGNLNLSVGDDIVGAVPNTPRFPMAAPEC